MNTSNNKIVNKKHSCCECCDAKHYETMQEIYFKNKNKPNNTILRPKEKEYYNKSIAELFFVK